MTKEQFIKKQATKLRIKHRYDELTELECEDFIEKLIQEAFFLQGVVTFLLCLESNDVLEITKEIEYELIEESKDYYTIKNDYNKKTLVLKNLLKKI